jgi:ribosomal protein L19E
MMITNQKRMAAQILSRKEGREVGVHRVWIHPDYLEEISSAVQKDDIRELIEEGLIKDQPRTSPQDCNSEVEGPPQGARLTQGQCQCTLP